MAGGEEQALSLRAHWPTSSLASLSFTLGGMANGGILEPPSYTRPCLTGGLFTLTKKQTFLLARLGKEALAGSVLLRGARGLVILCPVGVR